ncbi:TetR/AcrR family transcriptional regulator [Burkholderia sp. Ac-20379]|uniref:TetR/AcrR family transcriptional regulator n=1 Tax=Burkholderia sp. Ac-20379 TaxID=2703900 RepID=UPI001981443E|nr:TetR/AcrR family transcriptional regulator [Burkholderia sp. Ac-20379]MBN3723219.1 TetR/AcrR family transcriptional regulator [Burkholderia sp. Ac-20379]
MARPRSTDKQEAILDAAARALAEHGVAATTARIARLAGVAEGTVFTYFDTKDALLNALYLHLKDGLRSAMMDAFPHDDTAERRARHAWNAYVAWGVTNPDGRRALRQLEVGANIEEANRLAGAAGFGAVRDTFRECLSGTSGLSAEQVLSFCGALFSSMAEVTMDSIAREPEQQAAYREAGFRAIWAALQAH